MDFKIVLHDIVEAKPLQPVMDRAPASLTVVPPMETPPTPTPERTFPMTIVSRYRAGSYSCQIIPEIRFGGKYLEKFKFPIGTRLSVTVKRGRIIIRPHLYQPWLSEDLANEVREASGNDDT